jgi:hypothetical protein
MEGRLVAGNQGLRVGPSQNPLSNALSLYILGVPTVVQEPWKCVLCLCEVSRLVSKAKNLRFTDSLRPTDKLQNLLLISLKSL